jgi:predicted GIY-YIG superfamily endonuclease
MGRPFFVYMLQCANKSYYVGHTDDLERRVLEHHEGGKCAYTETRRPVQLTWSQEFATHVPVVHTSLRFAC